MFEEKEWHVKGVKAGEEAVARIKRILEAVVLTLPGKETEELEEAGAWICKPFRKHRNRFPAWRTDNPIWRTGPPGYACWRNRFLGSLNSYKYGLRGEGSIVKRSVPRSIVTEAKTTFFIGGRLTLFTAILQVAVVLEGFAKFCASFIKKFCKILHMF